MDSTSEDRFPKQKKHKKHKHKKHKKHRHREEDREDQEIEIEEDVEIDFSSVGLDDITVTTDPASSILNLDVDPSSFVGGEEIIEEQLVEIDDSAMDVINIEEMVLENYGQDIETIGEELEVDVGGINDELVEDEENEEAEEEEDEDVDESEDGQSEEEIIGNPTRARFRPLSPKISEKSKKKPKDGDGVSSEEEAWLDALESGKLEEIDEELKKIKNPKLLTARQRALLERKGEIELDDSFKAEKLLELPTCYKEQEMTLEALQKKALKSQKRREVAAEKREKEKKETIDRLLQKKQTTNFGKNSKAGSSANLTPSQSGSNLPILKPPVPRWTLHENQEGNLTLSLPEGVEYPLQPQKLSENIPVRVLCGVPGCGNVKKYSCSRSGLPLCSLQCYKTNQKMLSCK